MNPFALKNHPFVKQAMFETPNVKHYFHVQKYSTDLVHERTLLEDEESVLFPNHIEITARTHLWIRPRVQMWIWKFRLDWELPINDESLQKPHQQQRIKAVGEKWWIRFTTNQQSKIKSTF